MGWIRQYFRQKNIDRTYRTLKYENIKTLMECSKNSFKLKDGVAEVLFEHLGSIIEPWADIMQKYPNPELFLLDNQQSGIADE